MDNQTDIKTLMQMKIGDINNLEKVQMSLGDIIDRQKETVASYLEQEKVDEDWANNFLREMETNDN